MVVFLERKKEKSDVFSKVWTFCNRTPSSVLDTEERKC